MTPATASPPPYSSYPPSSTPRTSICSCSCSESDPDPETDTDIPMLDVLIIGAGPCGLAVAARIREETPSAMFTDDEHQRYHWIKKHAGKMKIIQARRKIRGVDSEKYVSPSDKDGAAVDLGVGVGEDTPKEKEEDEMPNANKSVLVLDSSGATWMSRWNRLFSTYEISHLRSPMFFHVDPMDRDGMLGYARETGRENELWELHGCVGQEMSKHRKKKKTMKHARSQHRPREVEIDERDRKDYWCPSSSLFTDYCNSVIDRYHLTPSTLVQQAEVTDLSYDITPESGICDTKIFTARTADGRVFYAKAVVVAVGPGLKKHVPWKLTPDEEKLGSVHSFEIEKGRFLPPHVKEKMRKGQETDVVVIGGGLTSSQVVDVLVKKGVTRVWYMMRTPLKVKHFDMSLNWVGKFRNYEKAIFWSADTVEEKLEMFHEARQGGSINPKIHKDIRKQVASGRVKLCMNTQVTSHSFNRDTMSWSLQTDNPVEGFPHNAVDYVYFATGMNARLDEMDFMKTMLKTHPAPITPCGFPHLTTDLEYAPGMPLFFTGRLASLHLGPGGPNLEGARLGAERVAWALEGLWEKEEKMRRKEKEDGVGDKAEKALYAFSGLGNRFGAFTELEIEC